MNSQPDNGHQQQQPGNGYNHQGPNQNHKPQHVDGPEAQPMPMPIPDPTIQYTKVSCTHNYESKFLEVKLAHNLKALGIQNLFTNKTRHRWHMLGFPVISVACVQKNHLHSKMKMKNVVCQLVIRGEWKWSFNKMNMGKYLLVLYQFGYC